VRIGESKAKTTQAGPPASFEYPIRVIHIQAVRFVGRPLRALPDRSGSTSRSPERARRRGFLSTFHWQALQGSFSHRLSHTRPTASPYSSSANTRRYMNVSQSNSLPALTGFLFLYHSIISLPLVVHSTVFGPPGDSEFHCPATDCAQRLKCALWA
jgi:hypothetical protein